MTARTIGSKGSRTAHSIQRAGARLIASHGFEAVSLRQLAAEVGLQPASLYNHIESKQALLYGLIHDHLMALTEHCDTALAAAAPGATDRLVAFVSQHIRYHLDKKQQVFLANFELRSLDAQNYPRIIALRRSYESRLIALLDLGVATGQFQVLDARIAAYAILAMLTGACTWYKSGGRLSETQMVALHVEMVLNGCVASPALPDTGSLDSGSRDATAQTG